MTPTVEPVDASHCVPRAHAGDRAQKPGLFLMTNSFEMGGSERQFAALAQSLAGSPFRVQLGCLAKVGSLLQGQNDVVEFSVGRNLYGAKSIRARLQFARY